MVNVPGITTSPLGQVSRSRTPDRFATAKTIHEAQLLLATMLLLEVNAITLLDVIIRLVSECKEIDLPDTESVLEMRPDVVRTPDKVIEFNKEDDKEDTVDDKEVILVDTVDDKEVRLELVVDKVDDKEVTEDDREVTLVFVLCKLFDNVFIFGEVMLPEHVIPE
jgi:hypothetical protein